MSYDEPVFSEFRNDVLPHKLLFYRSETFKVRSIKKTLTSIIGSRFDIFLVLVHHVVL